MNNKEAVQNRILEIVIDCCSSMSTVVTRDDVLGKSRKEVLVWIRAIVVNIMLSSGYLTASVANFLNRTPPAIRHLMDLDTRLKRFSKAYKIASEEAMLLCKEEIVKEK